jgi:hypothetical protein
MTAQRRHGGGLTVSVPWCVGGQFSSAAISACRPVVAL